MFPSPTVCNWVSTPRGTVRFIWHLSVGPAIMSVIRISSRKDIQHYYLILRDSN
jgi:hypothetical protein